MSDTAHAASRQRRKFDRGALLAGIDLAALADRLLPGGKGRGRSRSWPCPSPSHGHQTGATPPVSVFLGRDGIPRWSCHGFGCDAGGTAVDLVMVTQQRTAGEALRYLDGVAGDAPLPAPRPPVPARARRDQGPHPALVFHVDRCQRLLWSDSGMPGRNLLERRELSKEVLYANRVGYDPGPELPRRWGLPRGGPAVVLPVLDDRAEPRYLQARYLAPVDGRRYANPTEQLVGPSPRVAFTRLPGADADPGRALVCEGILDALSAAQAGYTAAAVLGDRAPDEATARTLLERFHGRRLVLAFDDDDAGRSAAERLTNLLAQEGAGDRVATLRPRHGDLNQWLQDAREDFPAQLRTAVAAATPEVYRVQVLQPPPAHAANHRFEHVQTFDLPARTVDDAVARRQAAGELAAASVEAAEAAFAMTHQSPPDLNVPSGRSAVLPKRALRSIAPGDILIVTAPSGAATALACASGRWRRLDVPPSFSTGAELHTPRAHSAPARPLIDLGL